MKSVKSLLVPFIVLVALIIGAIVYFIVDNYNNNGNRESSSGVFDVVYYNTSDVSALSVYNRDSGNTVLVKCNGNIDGYFTYEYLGDDREEGADYSQNKLYTFISCLSSFYCYSKVSETGNYQEYGLDDPCYVVTISTVNNVETKVHVGDVSPDGNYCYIYVDDSKDIYTISSSTLEKIGYASLDFLESKALNIDFSELKSVHFDRKTDGVTFDIAADYSEYGVSTYTIVSPYKHPASQFFTKLITNVASLEITDYLSIDKADLADYGLSNPTFHFVYTMKNGDKTELYFGLSKDGYYYGYLIGMDNYFKVADNQLTGIELKELSLIEENVFSYDEREVSSINCTYGDQTFKFSVKVPDDSNIFSDDASCELDGRKAEVIDVKGRSFQAALYESINGIAIGGIDLDAKVDTTQKPVLTLSFIDKDYKITEYEFFVRTDDSFYVCRDNEYMNFYVYSRELFFNGGDDPYAYGLWDSYELLRAAISDNHSGVYEIPKETT